MVVFANAPESGSQKTLLLVMRLRRRSAIVCLISEGSMKTRSALRFNPGFPGRFSDLWASAILMLLIVPSLFGQADSRAEEIQREREERHKQAKAETKNRVEKLMYEIEEKKLLRRISSGWNGF